MLQLEDIIIRPIITEKSIADAAKNLYTFAVNSKANKYDIKKAAEELFKVNVLDIHTRIKKGKTRSTGKKRVKMDISPIKIAVVKTKPDQKIDLFEVGGK